MGFFVSRIWSNWIESVITMEFSIDVINGKIDERFPNINKPILFDLSSKYHNFTIVNDVIRSPIILLTKLYRDWITFYVLLFSLGKYFIAETHAQDNTHNFQQNQISSVLVLLLTDLFNPIDVVCSFVDRFKFTHTQNFHYFCFFFFLSTYSVLWVCSKLNSSSFYSFTQYTIHETDEHTSVSTMWSIFTWNFYSLHVVCMQNLKLNWQCQDKKSVLLFLYFFAVVFVVVCISSRCTTNRAIIPCCLWKKKNSSS